MNTSLHMYLGADAPDDDEGERAVRMLAELREALQGTPINAPADTVVAGLSTKSPWVERANHLCTLLRDIRDGR